jgi:hypothetical protein
MNLRIIPHQNASISPAAAIWLQEFFNKHHKGHDHQSLSGKFLKGLVNNKVNDFTALNQPKDIGRNQQSHFKIINYPYH